MSKTALVVVDVLQTYDFETPEEAAALRENVRAALPAMKHVIDEAKDREVLTIFVNDNFGVWNAGRAELIDRVMDGEHKDLVEPILPDEETAFVVKARHSIFYETPLAYLLSQEEIDHLVLIGTATEQCILYSALDAYVRHLDMTVVRDGCAGIDDELTEASFKLMERFMNAKVVTSQEAFG